MAEYYEASADETVKLWSKKLWSEFRKADAVWNDRLGLVGRDWETSAFVLIDEPQKSIGDRVSLPISFQTHDDRGVIGQEVLEGKEDFIRTDVFKILLDEQRFGWQSRGRMNGQRVHFDTLEESKRKLRDKWKTRRAVCAINHLCGNTAVSDLAYTGLNAVAAPDDQHIYRVGQGLGASNDETVNADTTALFDVDVVDELVTIAEQLTPPIAPFMIDGNPYYGMFLHPDVVADLRKNNSEWYATMQNALRGGVTNDNPLFTRALGKWRDVLFFSEPHIIHGIHSSTGASQTSTRRNVFFGAGALCVTYGRHERGGKEHFKWYSGTWDHGACYYGSASLIWGCKGTRFTVDGTARDYGKIVVTSHSAERLSGSGNIGQ